MLTHPKFDLKLVATKRNGEQLELVRSFTLSDAEARGGIFCEIGRAAIGLYDDLEKFVADEKASGRVNGGKNVPD